MSFYEYRKGGSFFRSRNLSGYLKVLFEEMHGNGGSPSDKLVRNKMTAKYKINKEDNG